MSIAIIGAGPAGLGYARVLTAQGHTVDVYEAAPCIGGVWYYDPNWPNAMYQYLETNLSHELMCFHDLPFPEGTPIYPSRQQVYDYLCMYFDKFLRDNRDVTMYMSCRVIGLEKDMEVANEWRLTYEELTAPSELKKETKSYKYVVVANGHFTSPFIPRCSGTWKNQIHSLEFNSCHDFRDKRVVVVGNGSSGTDIANQISTVARKVYHSVTPGSETHWIPNTVQQVDVIKSMDESTSTLILNDGTEIQCDCIIWATGFKYSMPFLETYKEEIMVDGHGLRGLWKDIVFCKDPTLFFALLGKNVVPFPMAESQASIVERVISGEICHFEPDPEPKPGASYHAYGGLLDLKYYRDLQAVLDTCHGSKFQPRVWDERYGEMRRVSGAEKQERNLKLMKWAQTLRSKGDEYRLLCG